MAEAWIFIRRFPGDGVGFGSVSRLRVGGLLGSGRVSWRAFMVAIFNYSFS